MRNLKKLLAVIVAVCVLATITVPAFAADASLTDGEKLGIIGVMKGTSGVVDDTYLSAGTQRYQAAVIYLRLLGLEEEAYAGEYEENYADATDVKSANMQKALGYLYANKDVLPGWQGVGGGKFEPTKPATAQMIYKVLLEALGYKQDVDFTWAETLDFAAEVGLTKIADVGELTNADLATAIVEALGTKIKGEDKTLIEKLIEDGIVDEADAVEAGLVEEVPAALEVVDVKADNLVRVQVTFNKAIDKDSIDTDDFEVDGKGINKDDVSLSDDKKVATLKIAAGDYLSNGDEVSIEISGIKAADGTELKDYEGEFTPMDTAQPKVTSIVFVGPETAKITFSEPIDEDNNDSPEVIIDGGIYSAVPADGYENGTDVTVDLGTELDEGSHTFKVKGFEDYAGYSNLVQTIDVEYAAVKTAPSVTIKEATQTYVILKFERPVKDIEADDFYQSYSSWKALEVRDSNGDVISDTSAYHEEIKLVFVDSARKTPTNNADNDKPLPIGTVRVVVTDESVQDRWGNKIDGDVSLTATITADTERPTITKVSVESETEVRLYYSEAVKSTDATKEANFKIMNSKGEVVSATKWNLTYNSDDKYTAINIPNGLDHGDYTVTVEAIADTSLQANTLETVTLEFTITDKTADLSGLEADWVDGEKVLYVKYGDTMDSASVLNKANYRLSTTSGGSTYAELGSSVKLSMFTSKIVKIQFPASTSINYTGYNLQIGRVKDAAGNEVSALATVVTITAETAPSITDVKKIAENKFELTVDQELKSIASGAIIVDKDGPGATTPAAASYKFVNDGNKTKITITVPSAHSDTGTKAVTSNYVISIVADKIKSVTGVYVAAVDIVAGGALGNFDDGVAPAFAKDGNGDKVVYAYDKDSDNKLDYFIVKYTEAISTGSVSKYTYDVNGYTVKSVTVVNLADMDAVRTAIDGGTLSSADGEYVVIAVDELDDVDIDQTPQVTQKQAIEDLAGNKLEAQDGVNAISAADAATRNP